MDKDTTMSMLSCSVDDNLNLSASSLTLGDTTSAITAGGTNTNEKLSYTDGSISQTLSCWHWWQDYYYPSVITNYYPVYIREKSLDNGKQAYEIIKQMRDKKMVEVNSVKQFMELMDFFINIL